MIDEEYIYKESRYTFLMLYAKGDPSYTFPIIKREWKEDLYS